MACLAGNCQQQVFDLPLDSSETDGLRVFPGYDTQTANIQLTLTSRHTLRRYALPSGDSTLAPPRELTRPISYDKNDRKGSVLPYFDFYQGYLLIEGGIEEAFTDKKNSMIRFVRTRFHEGDPQQTDSIPIPPGESLFAAFYQPEGFYALCLQKASSRISIYHHPPAGGIGVIQKEVPVKDWGKGGHTGEKSTGQKRVDDLSDLIGEMVIIRSEPTQAPPLLSALSKAKCYVTPGKCFLTFDNIHLETRVLELPLDDRPCILHQFTTEPWFHGEPPQGFSNGNSYLLDSTLITAAIIHRKLYLAFYDLATGKCKTVFPPDQKGFPSFPHSPAQQIGDFWKKGTVHRIPMEAFYENSFDYWTLGITARHYGDDQLELEIGTAYDRETFGKFMVAFGSMGLAAGGVGTGFVFMGPGNNHSNTMFFKSQFHVAGPSPASYTELKDKSELIDTFADLQKIPRKSMMVLQRDGSYWLGFFDPTYQHYRVYKF